MGLSKEDISKLTNLEKVETLITALEIIANGDPIGVGLDEIKEVAQSALDYFISED